MEKLHAIMYSAYATIFYFASLYVSSQEQNTKLAEWLGTLVIYLAVIATFIFAMVAIVYMFMHQSKKYQTKQ